MVQKQAQRAKPAKREDESESEPKRLESDVTVDSILDEIDDVLEENAEEFVRSYIQQGGE